MERYAILHGDCLEVMRGMDAASVDAIVTDPPYGLSFMGKDWDHGVPGVHFWEAALAVAKPGTHLLAFGGTRTFHRLACAIEDAGWEIRDTIMWVYGSGFPKSHDVAKGIDKALGAKGSFGAAKSAAHQRYIDKGELRGGRGNDGWQRPWMDDPEAVENAGRRYIPATDEATAFDGWGTALKPAWEPIIVARKPLAGTVAANVIQHGTGAINVDACRIEGQKPATTRGESSKASSMCWKLGAQGRIEDDGLGRWPANLIHDGSEEVLALFPESRGQQGAVRGTEPSKTGDANCYGEFGRVPFAARGDTGSAARFFYCAKASRSDRGEGNNHPTVKPTELMRYLCRLVTPPGGVVLDPFAGSGSTGKAAMLEGFNFIGIELNSEYVDIARARIANAAVVV